jgi:hypothetical protein
MTLTAEQVEQYRRDGYVCPVPVMPAAETLQLRGSSRPWRPARAASSSPRSARGHSCCSSGWTT